MYNLWDRFKALIVEIVKTRVFVMVILFCVLFSILIARLFNLQIVKGQEYQDEYKLQIQKTKTIQGYRGNIYDRNGVLIAYNELAYAVTIEDNGEYDTLAQKNKEINSVITTIIETVESNGDNVISEFGIVLNNKNEYAFVQQNETQRLRFVADVFGKKTIDELTDKQKSMSAKEIIDYLCTDEQFGYGINQKKSDNAQVIKLVNVRYAMGLNTFQKYIATTVAKDVSEETVADIMENLDSLQGVDIAEESLRRYPDSKYFANIIGYTGQISKEEYDTLDKTEQKDYSLTDTIGKSGLEQALDSTLRGKKGEAKFYVNSVGKVIETAESKEPKAGNNVYLSLDANLQKAAYNILEQELAGILLSKTRDTLDYDRTSVADAGDLIIPSGDVYNAFIENSIVDIYHFADEEAGSAEKGVDALFSAYKQEMADGIIAIMSDEQAPAYQDVTKEQQAYLSYVVNDILTTQNGIIIKDAIDTDDTVYKQWRTEESINIFTYLNYVISQNWVDASQLKEYVKAAGSYSNASELYSGLKEFVQKKLSTDTGFDKLVYKYMIKSGAISGEQLCMILYEQNVLEYDEAQYNNLLTGGVGAYDFIRGKIQTLEITPGQLGLEPCTGSLVMTDTKSGQVLASVSYPGYDNNRLANSMDSAYYTKLSTDLSRPFFNNATQEKTAPGSTFKPLSLIAGLSEGVFNLNSAVTCDGVYKKVEPNIRCWVYPEAHGTQGVVGALTTSCNEFFCEIGYQLSLENVSPEQLNQDNDEGEATEAYYSDNVGLDKMHKYAAMFGLGEISGLEIPESEPEISEDYAVPSAMGQGTHNYTTSQLARYVTAVANKGTLYDLTLLDHVETADGKMLEEFQPKVKTNIEGVNADTWDAVHTGMRGVITDENAFVFSSLTATGFQLSGKTGTAQQSKVHPDHGLFVGFAPSNAPEIAFAIRIANGYSSTFTAEVGRDVMKYYYNLVDPTELMTGSASEIAASTTGD